MAGCVTFARSALLSHPSFWAESEAEQLELIDSQSVLASETSIFAALAAQITPFIANIDEASVNCACIKKPSGQSSTHGGTLDGHSHLQRLLASKSTSGFTWRERREAFKKLSLQTNKPEHLGHHPDHESAERIIIQRLMIGRLEACFPKNRASGNTQFEALSLALWGTPSYHASLRQLAVRYMHSHPEEYVVFLGDEFESYLSAMSCLGIAGDELTLRAIADHFGISITVVTSEAYSWCSRYAPKQLRSHREVFLGAYPGTWFTVRRQTAMTYIKHTLSNSAEVKLAREQRRKLTGDFIADAYGIDSPR